MDAHDPIPEDAISLMDAFNEVYFAYSPDAAQVIQAINDAKSPKEMEFAFNEYDESQAKANIYFRSVLVSGALTTFIRDPDTGDRLQLDRYDWAGPALWRPEGGFFSNHVGGAVPGPEASFLKGSYRPIFLNTDKFYSWFYAAFPNLSPEPDTATTETASEKKPKPGRGRPLGSGSYERLDAPIVKKMQDLIRNGQANSIRAAAITCLPEAAGNSDEAKIRRLSGIYAKTIRGV